MDNQVTLLAHRLQVDLNLKCWFLQREENWRTQRKNMMTGENSTAPSQPMGKYRVFKCKSKQN